LQDTHETIEKAIGVRTWKRVVKKATKREANWLHEHGWSRRAWRAEEDVRKRVSQQLGTIVSLYGERIVIASFQDLLTSGPRRWQLRKLYDYATPSELLELRNLLPLDAVAQRLPEALPSSRVREHIEAGRLPHLDELTLSIADTLNTTLGDAITVAALMSGSLSNPLTGSRTATN
jgi:hypothetical protein